MATWKDKLRKASFKGAAFYVASTEGSFGRKTVVHEFPRREFPFAEDLGKKSREFSIEAFVVGENYHTARNKLLEVCNKEGGGDLIHPYLGKLFVVCTAVKMKESAANGGMAEFSLSFVETSVAVPEPKTLKDLLGQLIDACDNLREMASAKIDSAFSIVGEVNAVVDSGVAAVGAVVGVIEGVEKSVRGNLLKIAEFSYKLRKVKAKLKSGALFAERLSGVFTDVLGTLKQAFGGNEQAARLFIKLTVPIPLLELQKQIPGERPSVKKQSENAQALDQFFKQVVISYQAEILAESSFASLDEAVAARAELIEVIEAQKEVADDDAFQALEQVRIALQQAVPSSEQQLSSIIELQVDDSQPSLVLSYDVFESLDPEADIIDRNKISRPGFIAPGTTLKVLQRG